MKAKKISRPTPASDTSAPSAAQNRVQIPLPPTREQIQALAHAIWNDRGCPQGSDVEIWLEAERQLCVKTGTVPAPNEIAQSEDFEVSLDPDRSDAARIERELDRIVSPAQQRSPTSL